MSESDHFYLPRHELKKLQSMLREVPDLALDLAITVSKQARIGGRVHVRRVKKQSELDPIHFEAAVVVDELHSALVGWVRLVCEQRGKELPELHSTPKIARWLDKHIIALAMTEGAETALDDIGAPFERAQRLVCPPPERMVLDEAKVDAARDRRLNARGIVTLAREIGEPYHNLTERRVRVLAGAGKIAPVPGPWHPNWPTLYRVGDVLDAHLMHPIRQRHVGVSAS